MLKRGEAVLEFGIGGWDGVFQDAFDGGWIPLTGTSLGAAVLGNGLAGELGGDAEVVHDDGETSEGTVAALMGFPEVKEMAEDGLLRWYGEVAVLDVALAGSGAIRAGDGTPAIGGGGTVAGEAVRAEAVQRIIHAGGADFAFHLGETDSEVDEEFSGGGGEVEVRVNEAEGKALFLRPGKSEGEVTDGTEGAVHTEHQNVADVVLAHVAEHLGGLRAVAEVALESGDAMTDEGGVEVEVHALCEADGGLFLGVKGVDLLWGGGANVKDVAVVLGEGLKVAVFAGKRTFARHGFGKL